MSVLLDDKTFMNEAFKQAANAFEEDEVPVGAVIVHKGRIIAKAHNEVEKLKDPTAHAEILAITSAASYLESKWLEGCIIYVTIEPCSMCAGALVLSRIKKIVYGAHDPKTGACGSILNIVQNKKLNHNIEVSGGVLEKECGSLLSEFFKEKRRGG